MRILINPYECIPFHGWSLFETPLGDIETGIIHLAEAFDALGHEVVVMTDLPHPPNSKPRYFPGMYLHKIPETDLLIAGGSWKGVLNQVRAKKRVLWTMDSPKNLRNVGLGDPRVVQRIDLLLCSTKAQMESLSSDSGFPLEKCRDFGGGVNLGDFKGNEIRQRKRLIYVAPPDGRIAALSRIFFTLKRIHTDSELHFFLKPYGNNSPYHFRNPEKSSFESLAKIFRSYQQSYLYQPVLQRQLARELMKSGLFIYPSTFEETSCIVALEAQAAGCPIIASDTPAMREIVGDAGVLVQGDPGSEESVQAFVLAADRLWTQESTYDSFGKNRIKKAAALDWKAKANELVSLIKK